MPEQRPIPDTDINETWETITEKTTTLANHVIAKTLRDPCQKIDRLAIVPRGGLFMANVISRKLGLGGYDVISLGLSKYDIDDPTKAGAFKVGQMLDRPELVEGKTVLLADEVSDSGETMQYAKRALLRYGALTVLTAAIHYKPGFNITAEEPDFFVEMTNGWVHYPWEAIDEEGTAYRNEIIARTTFDTSNL
jgi:hypoxanthine phosphoribosyltransferase